MSLRRSAISIIEVLVVVLIIGLLLALLLPAIQASRESARRAQCASNLRQVALAVQTYEQTHRRLPALYSGPFGAEVEGIEAFYMHSWQSLILPQLEEMNLYRRIDFSKISTHVDNGPAIATWLPVYVCPSATRSQEILDGIYAEIPSWPPVSSPPPPPTVSVSAAVTDYQPTVGVVWGPRPENPTTGMIHFGAWGEPLGQYEWDEIHRFSKTRDLSFKHVRDGLSRTMLICEAAGRPDRIRTGKLHLSYNNDPTLDHWAGWESSTWAISSYYYWYLIYQYEGHGGVNVSNFNETFYSFHPGGAHVAMCDGSVQFLAENTDYAVLQHQISRDRGD